ncbi:MAG: hypothetical protein AB7F22_23565 [Reyranella sp.]|uniref:hypothetical protein n=1 Tax=Reyranella sp. TaxID=1929291 RepID=UPI003D0ECD06
MAKYQRGRPGAPGGLLSAPRPDHVCVLSVERLTGKEIVLPEIAGRWRALDRSKTPTGRPPTSE